MPKPKFAEADFDSEPVEALTPDLNCTGRGFRCPRREFVTYFKQGRIAREVEAGVGRCWVLRHGDDLAAYVTLLADRLEVDTRLLEDEDVQYKTFPAVKIGLLAADERARGAGTRLVEWALEYVATELVPLVGVRFVTVDALYDPDDDPAYDTAPYYERFGFRLVNPDADLPPEQPYRTMYLDIKPFVDALAD